MFREAVLAGKPIPIIGGGTGLGKSIGRRYVELGARGLPFAAFIVNLSSRPRDGGSH